MSELPEIKVAMTAAEISMIEDKLPVGGRYLEFGGGGSTRLALVKGVARCDTIESDPSWIELLRRDPEIAEAEQRGRLGLHFADIGPVADWGMPKDGKAIAQWPMYYAAIWGKLDNLPDMVLVDGRFRVCCALTALMFCPPQTIILMHDFFAKEVWRRNYAKILDFADIVERTDMLVSLRRRPSVRDADLLAASACYWTDFA